MTEVASQMEMRHKQEMRELEGKIRALMKTAKKSNRAVVEAEAIRMGYDLKAKHAEEYESLPIEDGSTELVDDDDDDDILKKETAISDVAASTRISDDLISAASKKAKAQKKKVFIDKTKARNLVTNEATAFTNFRRIRGSQKMLNGSK